jgi:hypothetical protein
LTGFLEDVHSQPSLRGGAAAEAIQSRDEALDCFAPLAMTAENISKKASQFE